MTTLCLIELTNRINLIDDFGYQIDKPLCEEFQRRLSGWLRADDQGKLLLPDRYAVALTNISNYAHISVVASNVEKLFDQPFQLQGVDIMLQVRLGFLIIDANAAKLSQEEQLKQASVALNHARKELKLFSVYEQSLPPIPRTNYKMIKGLENALVQGQFRLHYQPKIHPTYKTAVGAEALLRWYLSEGKIFPPESFLSHAQASTFILPITYWAIKSAIARAASWKNDLGVSVNIANRVLCDPELEHVLTSTVNL